MLLKYNMNAVVLIFLFTCIYVSQGNGDKDECLSPWTRIESNCYLINLQKVSPDAAFALCLQQKAYLANLETLEETMLLQHKVKQMNAGVHFIVGGRNVNRYKPGGDWRWIKGGNMTKMTYFAFGAGQPDGSNASPQDCMFLYMTDHYQLNDVFCYDTSYNGGYICEK